MRIRCGRIAAPLAMMLMFTSQLSSAAGPGEEGVWIYEGSPALDTKVAQPKAVRAQSIASRATATSTITVYGAYELAETTQLYLLVRGPSLGTLGVTQNYLDFPRVTLYNAQGVELVSASGCSTVTSVIDYYQNVRRQPAHARDTCIRGTNISPGVYTFTVTPSSTSSRTGEVLFEVTLSP